MEWVEVRGTSIDIAVQAALTELGLNSRDEAVIEVVEEPTRGFLGMGAREALVRVSPKPKEKPSRRRKRGDGGGSDRSRGSQRSGTDGRGGGRARDNKGSKGGERGGRSSGSSNDRGRSGRSPRGGQQSSKAKERTMEESTSPEAEVDVESQAAVVAEFLEGLLGSFGLEGTVTTRVDEDLIVADVTGEQTEALIGPKGSIMQSVGELSRTVVQRKTHRRARLRLDIGGYQERRREALRIYTGRLAEQVLDDGYEIMLEPMNPADRKTVHDAVVEIEGVSSFSEGEEPNRSVVIALAPGVEPRSAGGDSAGGESDDVDGEDEEAGDSEEE